MRETGTCEPKCQGSFVSTTGLIVNEPSTTDDRMDLIRRVQEALNAVPNLSEFSRLTGLDRRALNRYRHEDMEPSASTLVRIAKGLNVSVDELVYGSTVPSQSQNQTMIGGLSDDFVPVPRLEVRASAGSGLITDQAGADSSDIMLRGSWLRSLGIVPSKAEFLEARGDSMEPTIRDGDLMLVDRGYGEVVNGKIYVLVSDGMVLVKRVHVVALGGLMLISDNDRYPTQTVIRADVESLRIEARVVWYGRVI